MDNVRGLRIEEPKQNLLSVLSSDKARRRRFLLGHKKNDDDSAT
jgi:hypothetical protein